MEAVATSTVCGIAEPKWIVYYATLCTDAESDVARNKLPGEGCGGVVIVGGRELGDLNGCESGNVSRGVESPMRGKVPGEMENSCNFKF